MNSFFKTLLIFLIISGLNNATAQQLKNREIQHIIDTTITVMKANAVNAKKTNWITVKQHALEQAATLDNPYQMGKVMRDIYKAINDYHGAFFYRDSVFQWAGRNVIISDSVKSEWNRRSGIKTQMMNDKIGYIRVPAMSGNNFNKKAQALNDSLCSILTQNLKGIIIDLRINGGGAMHPMILGLMQIFGNGRLGAFKTKRTENWVLKNNQFIVDTTIEATIVPKCVIDAHALPCVLLIGTGTGSSGEFLTMAFKGRAKTVFIGTETAGWITVNNGFPLSKITFMNLSIGYGLDRNGRIYTQAIQPDIYLKKNDKFNSLVDDEKVKAAIKWLKSH